MKEVRQGLGKSAQEPIALEEFRGFLLAALKVDEGWGLREARVIGRVVSHACT
jgi:hypothetical protein